MSLQSQPSQVLAQLLSNPGEIVTREELRRAIWAEDTFIEFDTALNVAINKIRQSLRDSASAPRFIETDSRRLSVSGRRPTMWWHPNRPPVRPIRRSFRKCPQPRGALPIDATPARRIDLSIAAVWVWSGTRASQSTHQIRSVAVLPFRPLIAEARDEALQGLAEAIIIRLGQVKQLRAVHLRPALCTTGPDPRVAGRELGVEAVLEGSFLRVNGNVRLSARLARRQRAPRCGPSSGPRGATSSRCRTDWRPKSAGRWLFAW